MFGLPWPKRWKWLRRANNSYWLQIEWQDQTGWLAGDLIADQDLVSTLPKVEAEVIAPAAVAPQPANTAGIYSGMGAHVEVVDDGTSQVTAVMAGYPADQAGIKPGDIITAVDGEEVSPFTYVNDKIRGEAGTVVTVSVYRPSTDEHFDFTITRAKINPANTGWLCLGETVRGFGKVWDNHPRIRKLLGCPFTNFRQDEHGTKAAVQTFEQGWMLWLETDSVANVDPIYVFFENDGSYLRFADQPLADSHKYAPTPDGFYKVGDRFAKTYWELIGSEGRTRLGRATNEARDSQGTFQEFVNGRMFWAEAADTIYVIYQGYYDFDNDGEVTQRQGWISYEDTFEAGDGE
ncbi:MAG: PDZ domain-containing protein [Chloroflexi bacterium]|nr:PDZ domain-containing protein [Chloroflexota bacterium]